MLTTFRSKIDVWLGVLLGAVIMIELVIGSLFLVTPPVSRAAGGLIAAGCFSLAAFIAWIVLGTGYEIGDGALVAHSGPFRFHVPLEDIRGVTPTSNPLSAPACSLDRLRVDYEVNGRRRSLLVSPNDKEGFLRVLQAMVPNSRIVGDRLLTSA